MSEILQYVITSLFSLLAGGGIGSIFYFKQQKKLKEMEVKAAEANVKSDEITNLAASNDEWIKLYHESEEKCADLQTRYDTLVNRLEEVHNAKKELWEKYSNSQVECSKKDLVINELNWYKCEINGSPIENPPENSGLKIFLKTV